MSADETLSLSALFARSVTAVTTATEPWAALTFLAHATPPPPPAAPDPSKPQPAELAISTLESLTHALQIAALISPNEEMDEIATRNIKYLLVSYLTALAYQSWQGQPEDRLQKLEQCSHHLQVFFQAMDRLRLLSESERDRVVDSAPEAIQTPTQKREEKIARFKLEKAAEKRLEHLMHRLKERENEDDEEGEREAYLVVIQSGVRRALDLHHHLDTEMQLLQYAQRLRGKGIDPSAHAQRARPKGPIPGMGGMPSTFKIVSERERVREGVFRPSHSLPTYTVEEWGEIEASRLMEMEREKMEKEAEEKRRKEGEDSDGDEAVDRETMEARKWDAWKDENNKGSGNTIR